MRKCRDSGQHTLEYPVHLFIEVTGIPCTCIVPCYQINIVIVITSFKLPCTDWNLFPNSGNHSIMTEIWAEWLTNVFSILQSRHYFETSHWIYWLIILLRMKSWIHLVDWLQCSTGGPGILHFIGIGMVDYADFLKLLLWQNLNPILLSKYEWTHEIPEPFEPVLNGLNSFLSFSLTLIHFECQLQPF